jgi:hypothetical protein
VAKQFSPVIMMASTWVVRKAMIAAYEHGTGRPAPLVYSRDVSPMRKVAWAASVAGAVALIEIAILHFINADDEEAQN